MSGTRVAVVTGAAMGVGRASAERLAADGAHVYAVDIDVERGEAVADSHEGVEFVPCDVTSETDTRALCDLVEKKSGRVDVLVNNAGGFPTAKGVEESSLDEWRRTLDLNLTSVFLMTKTSIPLLRQSEAGRVINIGSLAGQAPGWKTSPSYAAAKAGVHSLTRFMASEWADAGITVNALAPSAVLTERIRSLRDEEQLAATAASIPLGRYQDPGEVAGWVAFLASEEAAFMTGQTISLNGGRHMP